MVEREPVPELERRPTHQECVGLMRAMHRGFLSTCVQISDVESFSVSKIGYDFEGNRHSVALTGSQQPGNAQKILIEVQSQIDTIDVDQLAMYLGFMRSNAQDEAARSGRINLPEELQQALVQAEALRRGVPIVLSSAYSLSIEVSGNGRRQSVKVARSTALEASQKLDEWRSAAVMGINVVTALYESSADRRLGQGQLYCVAGGSNLEPNQDISIGEVSAITDALKTFGLMKGKRTGDERYIPGGSFFPPAHLMSLKLHGLSVRGVEEIL